MIESQQSLAINTFVPPNIGMQQTTPPTDNERDNMRIGSINQLGPMRGYDPGRLTNLQREIRPQGEQTEFEINPRDSEAVLNMGMPSESKDSLFRQP